MGLAVATVRGAEAAVEERALQVARAYIDTFNARDVEAWRGTLNFPHVRLASGSVRYWATLEDYTFDFDELSRATGWVSSVLDSAEVVQSFSDKVHITAQFTRYRADGSVIGRYHALWVVTEKDGHWGIQCRSSEAPL